MAASSRYFRTPTFLLGWLCCLQATFSQESPPRMLSFERDVRPIFKAHCFLCHGEEEKLQGELDLRLVRTMQKGGESGPAIESDSDEPEMSLLWRRIDSDEMPEGPKKLSAAEKAIIHAWIRQGSKTARAEPEDPNSVRFTDEELSHWAFRPVGSLGTPVDTKSASVPANIDRFIRYEHERHQLQFTKSAEPQELIRRLSIDLTGLPPDRSDVDQFAHDPSDSVWEQIIDRYLASQQYGVRWGRHWLDVAGYAESDGILGKDRPRPFAWHYRDYVIQSFNDDVPYDRFLTEQLAGDELLDGEANPENPEHVRLLAATGFLRMAPDTTDAENSLLERNQAVAETLKIVGSSILGLTIGCAQCHDHRYDPISAEDYYRFRAIFDPAMPLETWRRPSERLVDLTTSLTKVESACIENEALTVEEDIKARRRAHCQAIQDREINETPENVRDEVRRAVLTSDKDRTPEQKKLLDKYPKVRTVDWIIGQLVEYDNPAYRRFQDEEKKVAEIRKTKPLERKIMTVFESKDKLPRSAVHFRGDPSSPKKVVDPAELEILRLNRLGTEIPSTGERQRTSGRRLAFARQLTDPSHPLVARVIVNRVWMHHFGRGIVKSSSDFGLAGDRPSHPELLDYLASEFVRHGWSLKWLHKQLLLTRTYRQSSQREPQHDLDPENIYLARMPLRRLDAESLRDSILAAAGLINTDTGGPSVPVSEDAEGKSVIGKRLTKDGLFGGIEPAGSEAYRRSVYVATPRTAALNMLETFDLPMMSPNCSVRSTSTVATQALWLMNDEQIISVSEKMADAIWSTSSKDLVGIVHEAFLRAYACPPSKAESDRCLEFIQQQTERFRSDNNAQWQKTLQENPEAADKRALASLCQVLLSQNRMLYVP